MFSCQKQKKKIRKTKIAPQVETTQMCELQKAKEINKSSLLLTIKIIDAANDHELTWEPATHTPGM